MNEIIADLKTIAVHLRMLLMAFIVCFAAKTVDADNFLMLFNPFSQSHIFHLLPVTKELLRRELQKIT